MVTRGALAEFYSHPWAWNEIGFGGPAYPRGVSDEAGQHKIYWTAKRIIGGQDPVQMGKNNSGHGVGGSMIHYAGYTPRFHPSDFEVRSRDGVAVDWPISYWDLKPHYEKVELELPVAGQDWP